MFVARVASTKEVILPQGGHSSAIQQLPKTYFVLPDQQFTVVRWRFPIKGNSIPDL